MSGRVAITGLGAVCAAGSDVAALLRALRGGRSGIAPLARFSARGLPAPPVGEVRDLPPDELSRPVTHRLCERAAREAWVSARVPQALAPERVAVVVGTTTGGIELGEAWYLAHLAGEPSPPTLLRYHPASTVTDAAADAAEARGARLTISTACSSGANAILTGADLLRAGQADAVLAGGADALCLMTILGFTSLRLLSAAPCRPFDKDRDGLNLGEAGAFLVLEREDDARRRGARIHAWFGGGKITCDAFHMTAPSPSGDAVVQAMQGALQEAGLSPRDVSYVNAHGTATPSNDRAEALALMRVFAEAGAPPPPVSASKSALGHTLGAAGAIEAVITVLAVREGFLPPTLSTRAPEAEAQFDLVLGQARDADVVHAMSSSFGFGGNNSVLVFSRFRE